MLENIFNWLQESVLSFWNVINSVLSLLFSLIQSLVDIVRMLPGIVSTITLSIGFLPDMVMVFAGLSLVVSIMFLIAGRGK